MWNNFQQKRSNIFSSIFYFVTILISSYWLWSKKTSFYWIRNNFLCLLFVKKQTFLWKSIKKKLFPYPSTPNCYKKINNGNWPISQYSTSSKVPIPSDAENSCYLAQSYYNLIFLVRAIFMCIIFGCWFWKREYNSE